MTSISLDRIAQAFGMDAPKTSDSHQYATVKSSNADGSFQVQMNGALETVRAAKLCNAETGDRVLCVVHNGQVAAIARVGGVDIPQLPTRHTGTISKTYTANGFAIEKTTFYEKGGVVVLPIVFSATSVCQPGLCASIPAAYAPSEQVRVPLFEVATDWDSPIVGWANVNTDGTIGVYGAGSGASAWFGQAVWIKA